MAAFLRIPADLPCVSHSAGIRRTKEPFCFRHTVLPVLSYYSLNKRRKVILALVVCPECPLPAYPGPSNPSNVSKQVILFIQAHKLLPDVPMHSVRVVNTEHPHQVCAVQAMHKVRGNPGGCLALVASFEVPVVHQYR